MMTTMLTTQALRTVRINSFLCIIRYVYMVLSAATKEICRALRLIPGIPHTPLILGNLKHSVESSRHKLSIALIHTAEVQL